MTTAIGIACVLLFNVMQGVSAVYLSFFLQRADFFVVLFSVFAVIAIVFNAILVWNGGFRNRIDRAWLGPLALLNVTTAASWASFFYAVKHIEPALSSSFINAILPLATICAGYVLAQRSTLKPAELAVACALLFSMLLTGWVAFVGRSGMSGTPIDYAIGLGMSAICGIAMSVTNVVSKKLNNLGVTPEQIMAYRFLLLALGGGALASQRELVAAVSADWLPILFVAVVGNLLPIYALQLGIQRLKPVAVAFLIGLAPILVFFMQGFSQNIAFSWPSLLTTAVTTVIVLIGTYVSLVGASTKANVSSVPSEAVARAK
jgi:drug/metabolite transporter (DMT)-like permease